jgi:tRNA-binding EMAP/Myf-like protein
VLIVRAPPLLLAQVWHHENADKLFCEEIDIGEGAPRSVASGLREAYTLEQMQDRLVIVVCNLMPRKMQGFESAGMVLASKVRGVLYFIVHESPPQLTSAIFCLLFIAVNQSGDKVELVTPPEGSTVGSRVFVEGLTGEAHPANAIKKKKVWEAVAPDLHVNDDGVACYQGKPLQTNAGACRVDTIVNAPIS